ncbi:serine endoprotease DegQ [Veronia nyctiphanis]|uniref:Serine endoprotease DegQ n=1 Tax=Veronia nyctiphanis TaxID=1278244 RepID=A0A4Q0YN76_9GAMM|nr:Do family serine endopeptidase [Veronia nyctiphanis]RXJ71913.1 serine endoprotease DegQ [Veronia nyctiphanis]
MKKKSLVALSSLSLLIGSVITTLPTYAALPTAVSGQTMPSLAPMLEKVSPGVVSIDVEGSHVSKQRIPEGFRFFFGPDFPSEQVQERPFRGLGSGVIIDAKEGYIITNHHVIDGAKKITVKLNDGRVLNAELIGSDQFSDVALLKVDNVDGLTEVKLADSDTIRVGDFAIAIGNPFGLGQTVTSGIISALGRSGLNVENLENFIQTDAAINSGNSGGALLNLNGELLGINTAILGPNGGNIGIGFAIPSNMAKNLVEQIIEYGQVRRGRLGVHGQELTSELAEDFGYETNHGAFVSKVDENSAADKAGVKAGDIIVSVNGKNIRSFGELRAKIGSLGAGKKVELGLVRNGKEKTVIAVLNDVGQTAKAETLHKGLQGAELENFSKDGQQGVLVKEVSKDSSAAVNGLKQGDLIVGIGRKVISNLGDLRKELDGKNRPLPLNIIRGSYSMYLMVQ